MYDLKRVYEELASSPHVLQASERALQGEFRKQARAAGYADAAADFFLAVGGMDRSDAVLRDVYKQMCEQWLCDGRWLTTEEAQATETWTELRETMEEMPDFR